MKKKLTLGLFGFGCVGQGLYRVLEGTQDFDSTIKRICIKHPEKHRTVPLERFTTSPGHLLLDPEIDVIVELIDDADAAWDIIREAVRHGKAVVTANKRLVAEKMDEIIELQRTYGQPILYEGAVCGSIPIIRNLEDYYNNNRITRLEGIVNGSTNYILTKVAEDGKPYEEALREAQEHGFAESDPRLDVQGFDPAFKLSILVMHAFGLRLNPSCIIRVGIDRLAPSDLIYARENRLRIKLVAGAYRIGDSLFSIVGPRLVDEVHPLFAVNNVFNAVMVEGLFVEEQLFVGKGAGGNPTGSAVLSDLSALRDDYRYEYRKLNQSRSLRHSLEGSIEIVVSCLPKVRISPLEFVHFKGGIRSKHIHRLFGEVSLTTLAEWTQREDLSILLAPGAVPRPLAAGIRDNRVAA